jgi:hypothetical protein
MTFRIAMSAGARSAGRRCRSGRGDEAALGAARYTAARRVFLAGRPVDEAGDG